MCPVFKGIAGIIIPNIYKNVVTRRLIQKESSVFFFRCTRNCTGLLCLESYVLSSCLSDHRKLTKCLLHWRVTVASPRNTLSISKQRTRHSAACYRSRCCCFVSRTTTATLVPKYRCCFTCTIIVIIVMSQKFSVMDLCSTCSS